MISDFQNLPPRPPPSLFFPCSTQMGMKFIMLINVKMPTIVVSILTFISMVNTSSESLKANKNLSFSAFYFFFEGLEFHSQP